MRSVLLGLGAVVGALLIGAAATQTFVPSAAASSLDLPPSAAALTGNDPCPDAQPVPAGLRLPKVVPPGEPVAIELQILNYLYGANANGGHGTYPYRRLGWCVDKYVRDTGPFVHGQYYGTHPAVRIYYSPEVMRWLRGGRRGVPADGAVIIKEQYPPPAAAYDGRGDEQLQPHDWTVMIRRASASRDGWFWAEVYNAPTMKFTATQYPNAGFGLYCVRCHASANDALTFASTNNIKGFPGEPLTYLVDDSWRTPAPTSRAVAQRTPGATTAEPGGGAAATPLPAPHGAAALAARPAAEHEKNAAQPAIVSHAAPVPIQTFPAEPLDRVVANPHGAPQFVTSDQCMGCHSSAAPGASGPLMWLTPPPSYTPPPLPPPGPAGVNVSEYGEWRWSPMGLAGRDPVFFSQLESELNAIARIPNDKIAGDHPGATRATLAQQTVDICMRCHGVMGKRTNDIEHGGSAHFNRDWVFAAQPGTPAFHYGGLARDGISCTVCHHITQTPAQSKSLALVLVHASTGLFAVGAPDRLHGPFASDQVATHPMTESLDAKPVFSALTTSSRMCTSCHSINLPVVDAPPKIHPVIPNMAHDVEQNTYVEWVNSRFQTEYKPLAGAKSCQDCHMPAGVDNARLGVRQDEIQTKIALAQDQSYPASDHRAPLSAIDVRYRQHGFRRHELLGLNAFLLRTFQRNSDALGVRLNDYMSGSSTDLDDAIGNVVRQARAASARVDLTARADGGTLIANVGVTNLTGHRFPSGVGFRRAYLALTVTGADGKVVWASGAANANGEIVGADGTTPLPTEYFTRDAAGVQRYQPHFDERHPITRPDQVQIFEEIVQDKSGTITDSFIHRDHHLKDNRLLPQGWRRTGPRGVTLPANWLEATRPKGVNVTTDPRYADGRGRAVVTYRVPLPAGADPATLHVAATLWYQSWEPDFRRNRTTGDGPAAKRLRVLLGNLALDGTALDGWKLRIDGARSDVR